MKTDPISFKILSCVILAGVFLAFIEPTRESSHDGATVATTTTAEIAK